MNVFQGILGLFVYPSFSSAFANAFAYAAQIEVAITVALVWAFRKAGVVKVVDGEIKTKDTEVTAVGAV